MQEQYFYVIFNVYESRRHKHLKLAQDMLLPAMSNIATTCNVKTHNFPNHEFLKFYVKLWNAFLNKQLCNKM